MRYYFLSLSLLLLAACAQQKNANPAGQLPEKTPYAKIDLNQLVSCRQDTDCAPAAQYCISLPNDVGHCYTTAEMQQDLACTTGDPILVTGQPWVAGCK
jgi:hypothetical protein